MVSAPQANSSGQRAESARFIVPKSLSKRSGDVTGEAAHRRMGWPGPSSVVDAPAGKDSGIAEGVGIDDAQGPGPGGVAGESGHRPRREAERPRAPREGTRRKRGDG